VWIGGHPPDSRTDRTAVSPEAGPRIDVKPEEEVRMAALPRSLPPAALEKERSGDKAPAPRVPVEFERLKAGELGEPIDITSDTVETLSRDNLIAFKGNVSRGRRTSSSMPIPWRRC
jgi:hypothetical protein